MTRISELDLHCTYFNIDFLRKSTLPESSRTTLADELFVSCSTNF